MNKICALPFAPVEPGFSPCPDPEGVLVIRPRSLGLGQDRIVGGVGKSAFHTIDLSALLYPVEIHWIGADRGFITDGADTIVFQGVTRICLPECMCVAEGAAASNPDLTPARAEPGAAAPH